MTEPTSPSRRPDTRPPARATLARWGLGAVLAVGAAALLIKPGAGGKVLGLILGAAAVSTFVRKDRSSATVVAVLLLLLAAGVLLAVLTGRADWVVERYSR